ncbi:MAG: ABC transporter substrate-binding protein [Alphaproteobacteria bacterium]|nr:ABC transporter substrate-binding protein [Alphaproteobacteria bacterium]
MLGGLALSTTLVSGALISAAQADEITFWTPEEQPERLAIQEEMAAAFTAKTGHTVKVVPVSEKDLGTRMTAAFAGGELPDVVYHSIQYILPWTEAGILDVDANNEVVEALGSNTFAERALEIAKTDSGYATVPVDGWTQMVVYRKDLFEEKGLAPPSSFDAISKAIDALHNPPEMYAFTGATKIDETYMMQVLEHMLLANGYSPVDANGGDDAKLKETLEIYKKIAKASPPGELYWKQSRELYFAGKTAMIVWSPFIMDELAGLRDSAPPTINDDPTSRELASKTGFVTQVSGPGNPGGAGWADIRYMGVTNDADTDAAIEFVNFAMDEGYGYILSIAPEGKFPVRRGDASDPTKFVKEWAALPVGVDRKAPLAELYAQDVIDDIVAGLSRGDRWGLQEGQLSKASKIVSSLVFNRIVRQYIDDEISADEAAAAIRAEVAKID